MNYSKEFYQNGYVLIKGMFPSKEVDLMRAAFDRLKQVSSQLESSTEINNSKFIIENQKLKRVIWAGGIEPYLLEIGTDLRILKVVSEIFNSQEFIHLLNQAHLKTPGDEVSFKPHQDIHNRDKGNGTWSDVDGRGSFIQSMIAIDNISLDNGPVYFYPKSHLNGTLTEDQISNLVKSQNREYLLMEAGDIAFWSPYWVHGSDVNLSQNKARNTLINGYSQIGANSRVYTGSGTGIKLKIP